MANVSHMLRSKQAGFSLLETIAAIVLLALAFGAVMHVAGAATQLTGHARELNRVAMLADTTLDAAGRLEPLREGIREGWYDKRYRWRTVVARQPPLRGQTPDLRVYRIDLDVMWRDGRADRHAHFATLRLQDEPKPPAANAGDGS